jgi:hypothetical protein
MVLEGFTWLEKSPLGQLIQGNLYIFPIIEVFHLIGLAVLGGTVLLVNLRLLGWGLTRQSAAQLQQDVRPFMRGAIALSLFSGFLLFSSEATKCYYHPAFWYKMSFLAAALIFTFTWQKKVLLSSSGITRKLTAIVSVILWSGVGIGGRWIGFE